MMTPLPGCTPMKPGAAMQPFFGIEPVLMDEQGITLSLPLLGLFVFLM